MEGLRSAGLEVVYSNNKSFESDFIMVFADLKGLVGMILVPADNNYRVLVDLAFLPIVQDALL